MVGVLRPRRHALICHYARAPREDARGERALVGAFAAIARLLVSVEDVAALRATRKATLRASRLSRAGTRGFTSTQWVSLDAELSAMGRKHIKQHDARVFDGLGAGRNHGKAVFRVGAVATKTASDEDTSERCI
jgi:hypothetical protein